MKKSIIAASAASLAVAAMPVVGVFADGETTHTVKDNISVEITPSCTIRNANTVIPTTGVEPNLTNNYNVTMANGQVNSDIAGTGAVSPADNTMYVFCNSSTRTWTLSAVGSGTASHENELYGASGSIATGLATSGADSTWAFKVTLGTGATAAAGFTSGEWTAVPAVSSPKAIATGTGTTGSESAPAITTNYQVFVSSTQEAGTYTGAVTYTLTSPNA